MKAILIEKPGDESVLKLGHAPDPVPAPADLLIKVKFAGLNRADIMQRQGFYPPPPALRRSSVSNVPARSRRSVATLPAGGSAIARWRCFPVVAMPSWRSSITAPRCMCRPRSSDAEAAAMPEVYLTAFLNLFMLAGVKEGDSALIHGGGSGVGTASIQLLGLAQCALDRDRGLRREVRSNACATAPTSRSTTTPVLSRRRCAPSTNERGVRHAILDSASAARTSAQNLEALAQRRPPGSDRPDEGREGRTRLWLTVLRRHLRIFGSTLTYTVRLRRRLKSSRRFLARFGDVASRRVRLRPPSI
jgi:hypothetical protein